MREIKFRGKRLDNGGWVYGFVAFTQDKSDAVVMRLTETESICENVAPPTVGQFTGLYDKNGKEIYEGDIILERLKGKRKDGDPYEIVFEDCQWFGKNEYGNCTSLSLLQDFHEIKVIGNIHDNAESLKTE